MLSRVKNRSAVNVDLSDTGQIGKYLRRDPSIQVSLTYGRRKTVKRDAVSTMIN